MTERAYAHTSGFWCEDCHPEAGFMPEHCEIEECSGEIIPATNARCVSCFALWTGTTWVEADPLCECGCKDPAEVSIYRLDSGTHHYYVLAHLPALDRHRLAVEVATAEALLAAD